MRANAVAAQLCRRAFDGVSGFTGGFEVEHPVVSMLQRNRRQMSLSPTRHVLDVYALGLAGLSLGAA
jgi:hypothetical protein